MGCTIIDVPGYTKGFGSFNIRPDNLTGIPPFRRVKNTLTVSPWKNKDLTTKKDTKLHLIVRLQLWKSGLWSNPCHYFQVQGFIRLPTRPDLTQGNLNVGGHARNLCGRHKKCLIPPVLLFWGTRHQPSTQVHCDLVW